MTANRESHYFPIHDAVWFNRKDASDSEGKPLLMAQEKPQTHSMKSRNRLNIAFEGSHGSYQVVASTQIFCKIDHARSFRPPMSSFLWGRGHHLCCLQESVRVLLKKKADVFAPWR